MTHGCSFFGNFVDSHAPVYLTLFTDCETVGVDEGMGYAVECTPEIGLVVCASSDQSCIWEGCKESRARVVWVACLDADVVFILGGEEFYDRNTLSACS